MIFTPAAVTSADELLADARRLLDAETEALYADPEVNVSCGPNCNACCEHAIIVAPAEIRAVRDAVAALPPAVRGRIVNRMSALRDRLDAAALLGAAEAGAFDVEFAQRYFELHEPCPLLVDGACAVRGVRPLTCREYLVSSPPEHCAEPSNEHFVRIRRRRSIDRNFARVSAALGEPHQQLLALALFDEPPTPPVIGARSGPKMARILLGG